MSGSLTPALRQKKARGWGTRHTYQVLTKRSERLNELLRSKLSFAAKAEHIWWGVSVEDRKYGLPRIEHLRVSKAKMRFLSIEPLLEDLGRVNLTGIDWVIVGGESGPGARPMKAEWVKSLRDQCLANRVAFFFKQWGGVRKKAAGRELEGRTHDAYPQRVTSTVKSESERIEAAKGIRSEFVSLLPIFGD